MRMLLNVSIPVEFGNICVADGKFLQTVTKFVEKFHPESSYFLSDKGLRSAIFVFDVKESTDIPSIAEPFFTGLDAAVTLTPVMNLAEMKQGVDLALRNINN